MGSDNNGSSFNADEQIAGEMEFILAADYANVKCVKVGYIRQHSCTSFNCGLQWFYVFINFVLRQRTRAVCIDVKVVIRKFMSLWIFFHENLKRSLEKLVQYFVFNLNTWERNFSHVKLSMKNVVQRFIFFFFFADPFGVTIFHGDSENFWTESFLHSQRAFIKKFNWIFINWSSLINYITCQMLQRNFYTKNLLSAVDGDFRELFLR